MVSCCSHRDNRVDPAFLTWWTLVHFWSGLLFFAVAHTLLVPGTAEPVPFLVASGLHLVYELKDLALTYVWPIGTCCFGLIPVDNSLLNSVGDQIAMALGYLWAATARGSTLCWLRENPLNALGVYIGLAAVLGLSGAGRR